MDLQTEYQVAVNAVRLASQLSEVVRNQLVAGETLIKGDRSPVTVADFGVQALITAELLAAFPEALLAAEEDTGPLQGAGGVEMQERVHSSLLQAGRQMDPDAMLAVIGRGHHPGGAAGRFWTLDPIDGTSGFLRGGQYAIALALIEDGQVVLGVLGCPRLPVDAANPGQGEGCILAAVRGQGAVLIPLSDTGERSVHASAVSDSSRAAFCESVEAAHSDQTVSKSIAEILQITLPPVQMDSQCKYAAIARGDADIYLRLPTQASTTSGYEEKIWDHAAGSIVAEAAGCVVSDINGLPLDFSQGRTLKRNRGVVATNGQFHGKVIDAIQRASITPRS